MAPARDTIDVPFADIFPPGARCPSCNYELEGPAQPECPECGLILSGTSLRARHLPLTAADRDEARLPPFSSHDLKRVASDSVSQGGIYFAITQLTFLWTGTWMWLADQFAAPSPLHIAALSALALAAMIAPFGLAIVIDVLRAHLDRRRRSQRIADDIEQGRILEAEHECTHALRVEFSPKLVGTVLRLANGHYAWVPISLAPHEQVPGRWPAARLRIRMMPRSAIATATYFEGEMIPVSHMPCGQCRPVGHPHPNWITFASDESQIIAPTRAFRVIERDVRGSVLTQGDLLPPPSTDDEQRAVTGVY